MECDNRAFAPRTCGPAAGRRPWGMQVLSRFAHSARTARILLLIALVVPCRAMQAQRDGRSGTAQQGFDDVECRDGCVIDTLTIEADRNRRAPAGSIVATMILIDTIALPRRGAPPAPKERPLAMWMACDSTPCAAVAAVVARLTDRRLDDSRVIRRAQASWTLPAPLMRALLDSRNVTIVTAGRRHTLNGEMLTALAGVLEPLRPALQSSAYSPRMQLYIASFAAFGTPGDSTLAEDVGTASEPLMMPPTDTVPPTRVATLTMVGRGAGAMAVLVQDDATGAAPLFGVKETVAIALPARSGRRAVISGSVLARQRVETLRDSCERMKVWTYLIALAPADLAQVPRGMPPSPRPGDIVDRWNGSAVREGYQARVAPAEQRQITASRTVVAQFVRERTSDGLRPQDVQVLAVLPRGAGYVTNFGVIAKNARGWQFPTLHLRSATCR